MRIVNSKFDGAMAIGLDHHHIEARHLTMFLFLAL
jgi:hypothetical protein